MLSECNCKITYIFTNGDVAVCPYMVFACENEESKYKKKDFLYGNIFDSEFDLLKNCGNGCKAIKIAHGLSIDDCDVEM